MGQRIEVTSNLWSPIAPANDAKTQVCHVHLFYSSLPTYSTRETLQRIILAPTRGNTFQRRDLLALSSLRSRASSERSEGSMFGERSFYPLRKTLLKRLRLTLQMYYVKCIAYMGG